MLQLLKPACSSACAPQQEKPWQQVHVLQLEGSPLLTATREKPMQQQRPSTAINNWIKICLKKVKVLAVQLFSTLCNSMDCKPPGSSVPGILQAGILEWVAILFSKGSSQPGLNPGLLHCKILYYLSHQNEKKTDPNLWDAAKALLRGKFIVMQTYLKKEEKSQVNSLTLHLNRTEKK